MSFLDLDIYENSRDGRTCTLDHRAEVVPLHDFGQQNAPVVAWKARYMTFSMGNPGGLTSYGPRRTNRDDAVADAAPYERTP
ncbi:hypothetical protein [Leucobacter sp. M11]|uniref:hypothetical protein n=1 Tax=Leucobacter sp. M11 TaxID=2993565 RepID=UPI002D80972B|nr:hypothetical protein [Leucobacter sp. M11]MEB4614018.1 hypothetical protein [Leucobacter sp. M11]